MENISPSFNDLSEQNQGPANDSFFSRPAAIWALIVLCLPLFFFKMGGWAFFDPDEGRYAELPRELLKTGDWISPHLNGVLYFEKPPLLYWAVAAMYRLFGLHEWAGRMVPALAALAGVMLTYGLGRRMFGARAGFLGAVACATSILWILTARELVIDMLFSVLLFAGLAFWWLGHTDENAARSRNYFLAMWITLGAAMLAKGPVTLILIVAIVLCYVVCCGQTKTERLGVSWSGIALFLLVTAPWFVLVQLRNPGFDHFFWYGQNVGRFLGIGVNREHAQPFWYFFALWWPTFFPWSLFVPGALVAFRGVIWPFRIGDARTPRRRAALFCFIAFFGVTLFFSASTSKLPQYVLPALPAAAVLTGAYFDACLRRGQGVWHGPLWSGIGLLTFVLVVSAAGIFVVGPRVLHKAEDLGSAWAYAGAGILGLYFVAIGICSLRRKLAATLVAIVGGQILVAFFVVYLLSAIGPNHTLDVPMNTIRPGLEADGELIQYDAYTQGVNFYARRTTPVIGGIGELTYGIQQLPMAERWKNFPFGLGAVRKFMAEPRPVYCVVRDHKTAIYIVNKLDHGCREITWNERRSIVGNALAARITPPVPGGVLGLK